MTSEAQIKSVALFFSLALLDDQLASQAALATLYRLRKKTDKQNLSELQQQAMMVSLMSKIWVRYCKYLYRGQDATYTGGLNNLKNDFIDLGPWREFRRMTDDNEFLSVLWLQVIGFDEQAIAEGLNTTVGTVRHRVSRGLKYLGERMI